MEARRKEKKDIRAIHSLLHKWEGEKIVQVEIQKEEKRIDSEDKDDIWEELNESSDGEKTGAKGEKR